MSKAIVGAAEIAGAVALAAATGGVGGMAALLTLHAGAGLVAGLETSMLLGGVMTEAGAIAQALGSNQGLGVTTRQPAAYRQIIRGMRRVGGTIVYQSTTGSTKRQYNLVIVIASHPCWSITDLYLDGRRVIWNQGSAYNMTMPDGTNFGGYADPGTYYGPNGVAYSFGSEVFCQAHMGDQTAANIDNTPLFNNDPTWKPTSEGTPYLGGCTWVYLKLEADSGTFPQFPEIRFTVKGKRDIYDPRTGTRGYSENWALHVADAISDPEFGVGDPNINQDQLIAAANVCDELVTCAQGAEARYALHAVYNTSTSPGANLDQMMIGAAGRISKIGGEWFIWPAYWQGPSVTLDESILLDDLQWSPRRPLRDLCNRVLGTYIAPNYPYNVAGDLYDSNGYWNGQVQNNWPFSYQPTNFPMYAADALHGYGSDVYLEQDTPNLGAYSATQAYNPGDVVTYNGGLWEAIEATTGNAPATGSAFWEPSGVYLPKAVEMPCVVSISQAQRVAKILMMRNRQQGTGTMVAKFSAFVLQPATVMQFNSNTLSWVNKQLEVSGPFKTKFGVFGNNDSPGLYLEVPVQETDPSVYAWDPATEELTPYDVPANTSGATPTVVPPPTSLTIEDDASTEMITSAGAVIPRLLVQWVPPLDNQVNNGGHIEVQYQFTTDPGDPQPPSTLNPTQNTDGSWTTAWIDAGNTSGQATFLYVQGVAAYRKMAAQIRAVRANGGCSAWVSVSALSYGRSFGNPVAPAGTLSAVALSDGTAEIDIASFTTVPVGGLTASCAPSPAALTGLTQGQVYEVYYIDATFAGGTITPIATQNPADYIGKSGYFLIGIITTPTYAVRYRPSTYSDLGSSATQQPQAAYDGDVTTAAAIIGRWWTTGTSPSFSYPSANGDCIWGGFPKVTITSNLTLSVILESTASGTGPFSGLVNVNINGTVTNLVTLTASTTKQTYTMTIPSGTDLSTVTVEVSASVTAGTSPGSGALALESFETYIQ